MKSTREIKSEIAFWKHLDQGWKPVLYKMNSSPLEFRAPCQFFQYLFLGPAAVKSEDMIVGK